jgi:hypothetical protein
MSNKIIWTVSNHVATDDGGANDVFNVGAYGNVNAAYLDALRVIVEWAEDWGVYSTDNVAHFSALVANGEFGAAIEFWNTYMTRGFFVYVKEELLENNDTITPDSVKEFLREHNRQVFSA